MTKEQWADIQERVGLMLSDVNLVCDGYLVKPHVERSGMKLAIAVYVNGYIRGSDMWFGKENEIENMGEVARKFHHWIKRRMPAKKMKQYEAIFGKRECKKRGYHLAHVSTRPYFPSAKAFVSHIKKHCETVEEISGEDYCQRLSALEVSDAT